MLLMATPRWIPGQDGSFCVPHDLHLGILFCCQVRLPPLVQRTVPVGSVSQCIFQAVLKVFLIAFLNFPNVLLIYFPMSFQLISKRVLDVHLDLKLSNLRPFIQIRTYHTFFCVFNFRLCVCDCPNWRFFVFS